MKWISVILSIQIFVASLLPQMDFAELSKLPTLVKHYKIHQTEQNYKGSFLDFISLHYGEKNNDGHDHSNLPFKNCSHTFDYNFVSVALDLPSSEILNEETSRVASLYKSSSYSNYFNEILQPPKIG